MKLQQFNDNWTIKKPNGSNLSVTLPYDAMIHEERKADAPSESAGAYFLGGVYEYEKEFFAPNEWENQTINIYFEGVYKNAEVYINDALAGSCTYGYRSFMVNTTNHLKFNENNIIKVIAKNDDMPNSRWYTGSGIYRPVWISVAAKEYIEFEGVKISTVNYETGEIKITTAHVGGDEVKIDILDGSSIVASAIGNDVIITIPNHKLWCEESPFLYKCQVSLLNEGNVVDQTIETFGIRHIEWSSKGFFVNGKNTLLRGGCIHHDNGIIGANTFKESEYRRVKIIKDAGFNALRVSHNPACKTFLEACDEYGIYVIDETWDMWYKRKSKYDYANDFDENYVADINFLVQRDYNHPSVIMYSIGNEVSEPAEEKGVKLTEELVSEFHIRDSTRPVSAGMNLMIINNASKGKKMYSDEGGLEGGEKDMSGMNSTMFNLMTSMVGTSMNRMSNSKKADKSTSLSLDKLDISGYNYASGRYPLDGKAHPNRVVVGSETFPQDIVKNWKMVEKYPYLIGDFMWTVWDYLGEVGIGAWAHTNDAKGFNKPYPWILAAVGAFDILGNPTGEVFLAQAAWKLLKKPVISVQPVNHGGQKIFKAVWRGTNSIPSWSWSGCEGTKALVEVYSTDDSVELQLNGKKIGRKKVKNCKAEFKVPYTPGKIEAISYKNGSIASTFYLESATGNNSIQISPEKSEYAVGEIAYINIDIVGENGVIECNADTKLSVQVQNGELLGFGSANPRTEESYTCGEFTSYYGRSQAIVRVTSQEPVTISVQGYKLDDQSLDISVKR